jgi:hypothetical protein
MTREQKPRWLPRQKLAAGSFRLLATGLYLIESQIRSAGTGTVRYTW